MHSSFHILTCVLMRWFGTTHCSCVDCMCFADYRVSCNHCHGSNDELSWLDISSKYCHGSMTGDDCYGSWLGCLSFDDYHGSCDDWAWGLKAVMGHAITGHNCNSWCAECACLFLDCHGSSNGFEPHQHHWGPGRVFRDTRTLAKKKLKGYGIFL